MGVAGKVLTPFHSLHDTESSAVLQSVFVLVAIAGSRLCCLSLLSFVFLVVVIVVLFFCCCRVGQLFFLSVFECFVLVLGLLLFCSALFLLGKEL